MENTDSFKTNIEYAKKVIISLVRSPIYSDLLPNIDEELKLYFKETHQLKLNEFFQIKSIQESGLYYQFKVIDVEPKHLTEFQIDNLHTTLVQTEGSIIDKWIWKDCEKIECLKSYVKEIEKTIKFYEIYHQSKDTLPIFLLYGPNGSGKTRVVEQLCSNLNLHLCKINGINLAGESASAVEKRIEIFMQQSINFGPCIILIKSSLTEQQRSEFFKQEVYSNNQNINSEYLSEFLKKTNGLYYGELRTLNYFIEQEVNSQTNSSENFNKIFEKSFKNFSVNRKFQQENKLNIDLINWNDVGGLNDIKQVITDTILLPLNYPSLFSSNEKQLGITRSGILLYGPPGTGKTLLAKAISNECGINFLSVKGPELLDMYVGQTELNVRNLFEKARLNSPCVLFFDELDSLAPIRGRAGDSGGVMDRVVSQLLTEIDGLDKFSSSGNNSSDKPIQIFLIGATNRPDLIDASLLRPGRFDKLIYVPIAKTLNERLKIFNALIRKLPLDPNFDPEEFVKCCPTNLSGADFYSITNKARQEALKRLINYQEENSLTTIDQELMFLNKDDFRRSLIGFQPTLNETALLEYEKYFHSYSNKQ